MDRSCETCLRGPEPSRRSACIDCGDDLVNFIAMHHVNEPDEPDDVFHASPEEDEPIFVHIELAKEIVNELDAICQLAGVTIDAAINLFLAVEMRKWRGVSNAEIKGLAGSFASPA